jgi:L-methionine (R)-S-oxide reductase
MSSMEQTSARGAPYPVSWRLDLSALVSPAAFSAEELAALFLYRIPLRTGDEGCARAGALEAEPFDLHRAITRRAFDAADADMSLAARLFKLRTVVSHVASSTGAQWAGVYRVVPSDSKAYPDLDGSEYTLLKEAYIGAPSRPFFPLTTHFASKSNNSTVGLTGDAVLIHDTRKLSADTPYYSCDGHVRSELCAPIVDPGSGSIMGIMDVEAFSPNFFTPERVACVLGSCAQLASVGLFSKS